MAHYDLEEQEQIDTLKTWWKMYGNRVARGHRLAGLELVPARTIGASGGHL